MKLTLAILLAALCLFTIVRAGEMKVLERRVLMDSPIRVEALTTTFTAAVEQGYYFEFFIRVDKKYEFVTASIFGSPEERIQRLKPTQIDDYLFVPRSCGGGNAWKCEGFEVFKTSSEKPTYLGLLAHEEQQPYKSGYFFDTFDKLEETCTCHTCAPFFELVFEEHQGKLVLNTAMTKKSNSDRIYRSELRLKDKSIERRSRIDAALNLASFYKVVGDKQKLDSVLASVRKAWPDVERSNAKDSCESADAKMIEMELARFDVETLVEKSWP